MIEYRTSPYSGRSSDFMVVFKVLALSVVLALFAVAVSADVTCRDIDEAIDTDSLKHPYLYFSDEDLPGIRERIRNEPAYNDIFQRQLAEANRLLYTPVDPTPPTLPVNRVYDNTWEFERYILDNAAAAYDLAFVYQITGEEKYALKAFEFADVVCDIPTWVHGYHEFPIFYDRVWPWGASDDQVVFNYAQWSDHVVLRIAAVYDWLYPALEKRQRDRIRGALLEKAILRVRGNYEYHWWASAYRCNWCTVCNASLGVASLALLTEDPQLTDVVAESFNRIGKTFDQVGDGGWQEGMSYLVYTVNAALPFADALKRITGGRYNLYRHTRIDDVIRTLLYCFIPPDKTVHFSDCSGRKVGSYTFYTSIIRETGNRNAAWLRRHVTDEQPSSLFDLLRPECNLTPELPQQPSIHFRSVDWVIMRSDFVDDKKVVIAAKSGKNDDPHHGHLDAGHFSLYWNGCEFISDNGSAVQDKLYFYKERWDYPHASSVGHNVVLVNGEKQIPCKVKNRPWNYDIGGTVVEFRPGEDRDYAILDPSNAYPRKEFKSWRRHIVLEKPVITVVLDEVTCSEGAEIEVRFHSAAQFEEGEGYVMLRENDSAMFLIPFTTGDCVFRDGKHPILPVDKNSEFRWIPYFGNVIMAQASKTLVGAIILPVTDAAEAGKIMKSLRWNIDAAGNGALTFTKAGNAYSYSFVTGTNGLALE